MITKTEISRDWYFMQTFCIFGLDWLTTNIIPSLKEILETSLQFSIVDLFLQLSQELSAPTHSLGEFCELEPWRVLRAMSSGFCTPLRHNFETRRRNLLFPFSPFPLGYRELQIQFETDFPSGLKWPKTWHYPLQKSDSLKFKKKRKIELAKRQEQKVTKKVKKRNFQRSLK